MQTPSRSSVLSNIDRSGQLAKKGKKINPWTAKRIEKIRRREIDTERRGGDESSHFLLSLNLMSNKKREPPYKNTYWSAPTQQHAQKVTTSNCPQQAAHADIR